MSVVGSAIEERRNAGSPLQLVRGLCPHLGTGGKGRVGGGPGLGGYSVDCARYGLADEGEAAIVNGAKDGNSIETWSRKQEPCKIDVTINV